MKTHKIALIPGDGIGQEVMPVGVAVLEKAASRFGFALDWQAKDWSCERHVQKGAWMPEDWKAQLLQTEAIYFGAVGWPATVPDHLSLWTSLIKFRREFDQYINLRPVRLFEGLPCPLVGRKAGDIDYYVVRENTEGEYSSVGGTMFGDTDREVVIQQSCFSRTGTDRALKYAFELAQSRPKKHLTSATKSNGIAITMPYWDSRVEAMAKHYPEIRWDKFHIDILSAHFVTRPDYFDVVVASNLFGDILSDLGPATCGTIAIAPAANINPERLFPSLFEPVHGSAPDIAFQGIANPIGTVWAGAMMLEFLGHANASAAIMNAIELVIKEGPKTRDMGGKASTTECGNALVSLI
jgi:tartrate dehydrogenase/decarboxylase / D-malate dehydrogenase